MKTHTGCPWWLYRSRPSDRNRGMDNPSCKNWWYYRVYKSWMNLYWWKDLSGHSLQLSWCMATPSGFHLRSYHDLQRPLLIYKHAKDDYDSPYSPFRGVPKYQGPFYPKCYPYLGKSGHPRSSGLWI